MAEQNSVFLDRLKATELWKELKEKSQNQPDDEEYIAGMKKVCKFAADRSVTIRDTFPLYTRHDEQHIFNVIKLMENLLSEKLKDLNRDEAAMLILAACCHDIGMSCSQEKEELLKSEQMKKYLNTHASEYLKAYASGGNEPVITDDIFRNFLRSIHHERIGKLLNPIWESALDNLYNNLIWVCQSHGKSCSKIEATIPESESEADLRLCAVLLRLADILDFDTTRAPQAIYDYCGLEQAESPEAKKSKEEWDKHIASKGFHFESVKKRDVPYELPYRAVCHSMQTEQAVNRYLDWVDRELTDCSTTLRKDETDWKNLVLPDKVKRSIRSKGYMSGQYLFTLDQSQVLNLLGGEELYSDPAAFVRELLQNAIDAVRTREAFDREAKRNGWKPQINIRTWTDKDGDWFRIEDNGTGMTKEIIENHLLKVGSSYYNSDEFKKEKRLNCVDDYTPISRFGIGILSCFMGDKEHSRVEISTKRYGENYPPALRLRMDGLNGYYAMYSSEKDDNHPGEMPGCSDDEKQEYRNEPGTVVAVRTNLYRTGKYHGFKEIVDKWLVFPPVPVHYDGSDGTCDYPTQEDFMKTVHEFAYSDDLTKDGVMEIPLSESQLKKIQEAFPGIIISDSTKVVLKCADLERYSQTKNFAGVLVALRIEPEIQNFFASIGGQQIEINVSAKVKLDYSESKIELYLSTKLTDRDRKKYRDLSNKIMILRTHLRKNWHHILPNPSTRIKLLNLWISGDFETIRFDFDMTEEERSKICDELSELKKKNSISKKDFETWKKFNLFERQSLKVSKSLKEDKTWYNTFFRTIQNLNCSVAAAHDGIFCGDADFFCKNNNNYGSSVVLQFRDGYRPEMNLERNKIQGLSLEPLFICELIRKQLKREGFFINYDHILGETYRFSQSNTLLSMLDVHTHWKQHLTITTVECSFPLTELEKILQDKKRLRLSASESTFQSEYFYTKFLMAYLQVNYVLYLNDDLSEIILQEGKPNCQDDGWKLFPPGFFIPVENGNESYFTQAYSWNRCSCNANHPLAKFLLSNAKDIKSQSPGCFNRIVSAIANLDVYEDDGNNLISVLNDQLQILKSIPGNPLGVTDDLLLKESDLIGSN